VQKAAVAAMRGSQECVEEMITDYKKLRDQIVNGLRDIKGVTCVYPEGAFYAYPNVSAFIGKGGIRSAGDVAGRLLRDAHVVTVPGEAFGTHEHIRLSYATSSKEIARGLERMKEFFGKL
jgi:aspartate aminotransferase